MDEGSRTSPVACKEYVQVKPAIIYEGSGGSCGEGTSCGQLAGVGTQTGKSFGDKVPPLSQSYHDILQGSLELVRLK